MRVPLKLLDSLQNVPGFDQPSFIQIHESGEQITSVRLNPFKHPSSLEILHNAERVPWCANGYYLPARPSFTLDPVFHAGCYYVQEASSMFLEEALKQTVDLSKPLRALDLCAAPGGKTTLIQSLITEDSLLVSNEVIKSRVNVLQENTIKWGAGNVVITNNDASVFSALGDFFDLMVIDAPCSGSGLFRKDPEAITEWSENNVALCSQRQQRILADSISCLKENGILIYSTCSYSEEENEKIIDWLSEEFQFETIRLQLKAEWGIVESISPKNKNYGYRFYPGKVRGEGFFIACLRKMESKSQHSFTKYSRDAEKRPGGEMISAKQWLIDSEKIALIKHGEDVLAMPASMQKILPLLQKHLYIRQAGTVIGKLSLKELIPDHALALSHIINPDIASIALNKEQALQYLRKEEVGIPPAQRGWNLVRYEGQNLGWIKVLSNRVNNYYPKEWRILRR